PASHRGRINGLMSVAYTAVAGVVDIAVGQLYDRAGSAWAWVLILSVVTLSTAAAIVLKALDKKAYPKLYGQSKTE
ncbi:MAG: hypothetical protein J5830_03445, partial [Clostridia bacterium]|nr:hypothetical protein [Clostridia bacterium]